MKRALSTGYSFRPQARQIDFSGIPGFDARFLLLVENVDAGGRAIYAAANEDLPIASISGSVVTFVYNTNSMAPTDRLRILYDDGAVILPTDAATATRQDQARGTLIEIRDAIKAQRVETIWTDDTGARFIRVDMGGTIAWTDVAGNASSAPGSGARPDSDSGTVVSRSTYRATASGTGFATGDVLDHLVVTDGDAGDLISNFWINVTGGTKIAAPSAGSITPLSPLPDGAATSSKQDDGNTLLTALRTGIGTPADAATGSDGAQGSLVAKITRLLGTMTGIAGTVALDGADATGVSAPAGAAGIRGWLSGIYAAVTGTLRAQLVASTALIGTVSVADALVPSGSPFTLSAAGTLFTLDTTGYGTLAVHVTAGAGAGQFEASNDNANWFAVPTQAEGQQATYYGPGLNAGTILILPLRARYVRLRATSVTTAISASVVLRSPMMPPTSINVASGSVAAQVGTSAASGGLASVSRIISAAATTNATSAKAGAGRVYKVTGFNAASSVRWLRFFNKVSAPTVGTDTPFFAVPLPPGAFDLGTADLGYFFSTGIAYALTTGAADTDTGALTAGDVLNLNVWVQ